jgi:hypothetical protein
MHSINQLFFLMEAQWLELNICVSLKFIIVVKVFAIVKGLIRRPFTAEVQVRLWTSLRKIYGGQRGILRLKCDGTRAETRFRLSAKCTSPFKSVGGSVQSTTGSRGVRISGRHAGYTMFRGSVKGTGYPLHSPVSPSLPLPCVTACHHISAGLYCERFSPSTSAFPCQDHYTKTPYSSSFVNYCSEGRANENWERSNSNPAVQCGVGGAFGPNSSLHTLVYSPQKDLLEFFF